MEIEIRKIAEVHTDEYDAVNSEHGTVFNSTKWLSVFDKKVTVFGLFNKKNGSLLGGFHLFTEVRKGLKILREPPFTPFVGPFLNVPQKSRTQQYDFYKKVGFALAEFLKKQKASVISCALHRSYFDMQPFIWEKFKVIPQYTYVLDLGTTPEESIVEQLASDKRTDFRKALKDGIVTKRINDLSIVKDQVIQTFQTKSSAVDTKLVGKICDDFATETNSFAFASYLKDKVVAASMCLYDQTTAYYLLGGSTRQRGASLTSLLECIKHAKKMGLKFFDFEGSMDPKIEKFFRGFGGELTPYYRVNSASIPMETVLKFFKKEWF